jgi:hypothetical protein
MKINIHQITPYLGTAFPSLTDIIWQNRLSRSMLFHHLTTHYEIQEHWNRKAAPGGGQMIPDDDGPNTATVSSWVMNMVVTLYYLVDLEVYYAKHESS